MTKEEVIREVYDLLNLVDKQPSDLGWISIKKGQYERLYSEFDIIKCTSTNWSIRPKSLQGIETNNGWVKVESEADLPKDSFNYYAFCSNGSVMTFNDFEYYKKYIIPELKVTHYQPIVKPKPPLY